MPEAEREIEDALIALDIPIMEIVAGGCGEAGLTQRLRRGLAEQNWVKRNIQVRKLVKWGEQEEEREVAALSHEIDHVKSFGKDAWIFALEIEWNNKDPFFDRDLESFKRLHAEGAVSVGGIITRGESMQRDMRSLLRRFADDHQLVSFDQLDAFGYTPTQTYRRTRGPHW